MLTTGIENGRYRVRLAKDRIKARQFPEVPIDKVQDHIEAIRSGVIPPAVFVTSFDPSGETPSLYLINSRESGSNKSPRALLRRSDLKHSLLNLPDIRLSEVQVHRKLPVSLPKGNKEFAARLGVYIGGGNLRANQNCGLTITLIDELTVRSPISMIFYTTKITYLTYSTQTLILNAGGNYLSMVRYAPPNPEVEDSPSNVQIALFPEALLATSRSSGT